MSAEKKPSTKRSINLGKSGETPKKQLIYSIHEAPNTVQQATPLRGSNNNGAIPRGVLAATSKIPPTVETNPDPYSSPTGTSKDIGRVYERPKTSRGKSCPSPDEFYDYVIPSPSKGSEAPSNRPPFPESVIRLPFGDDDEDEDAKPMPPRPPAAVGADSPNKAAMRNPLHNYNPNSSSSGSSGGARRAVTIETIREVSVENSSADASGEDSDDSDDSDEEAVTAGAGIEAQWQQWQWQQSPSAESWGSTGTGSRTGTEGTATDEDDDNAHNLGLVACWLLACALKA